MHRNKRGVTLLEMMVVTALLSLALVPLFKWQTFVMGCLRSQDDSVEVLLGLRSTIRYFERDVSSSARVITEASTNTTTWASDREVLVLEQDEPGESKPLHVVYGRGDGTSLGVEGPYLMRGVFDTNGKAIGTPKTLATHVSGLQFDYDKPGRVKLLLESTVGIGQTEQTGQIQTAAALRGRGF